MRQSRSTTTPTKAETAHIERIKRGWCACCQANRKRGLATADGEGCDAHHVLSGGRRRGHLDTLGLCPYHHRGVIPAGFATQAIAVRCLGPSLAHGSKPFRAFYGSDADLLAQQRLNEL